MKVFLTGASGFLGKHLIEHLLEEDNIHIVASTSRPKYLETVFCSKKLQCVDKSFFKVCEWDTIDFLIHCAFPRNSNGNEMADGLKYTTELMKTAVNGNVKAVINVSSQSVYSQKRNMPAEDDNEVCLESIYSVGKYATELITNALCSDICHTNLRMASLIGAEFEQRLPNRFIKQALRENLITVVDGDAHFGFLDVRDAVNLIIKVIQSFKPWRESYNVGSGMSYTPVELAKMVAEAVYSFKGRYPRIQVKTGSGYFNSATNATAAEIDFNWVSLYKLEDSILAILKAEQCIDN